ncbi:hypothetical protein C5167_005886 [Papaver somniferum]|uniref:Uncharacterized protein n=1 Tax=Papaver somniferum TaxID=3469 RepID=A0A4Y7JFL0_PAPSO|nr:nucleolin-like [Papaver somniferum]RZC58588.1 hypothetical protein C5167_005886 [Papaver somniferum]
MKISQALKMTATTNQSDGEISYENLREKRIKENMERMLKLGISDLSKKLKSKPPPPLPKKSIKKNKSEVENTEPPRRSSRLEKLTPVSYSDSRPNTPKGRRNQMEEEEEDDDDEENEEDESEDEDGNYRTRARFNSDLCGRLSTRLQKVSRVNYAEVTPKKTNIEKDGENGKEDVLVEEEEKLEMGTEEEKPEMDTEEDQESAKQPVSVNWSLVFDNVEQSLHPIESVNSCTGGKDPDVGDVTSPKQT